MPRGRTPAASGAAVRLAGERAYARPGAVPARTAPDRDLLLRTPSPGGGALPTPPAPRSPEPPTPLEREPLRRPPAAQTRGERLVAWSALGVLAVAALLFVERMGVLHEQSVREALAPTAVAPRRDLMESRRDAGLRASAPEPVAAPERAPRVPVVRAPRPPPTSISAVRKPPRRSDPATPARTDAGDATPSALPTRWDQMREEIALCPAEGFFAKLVCEIDVRTRYCSGWWGSTGECPSGRTADYGN